MTAEITLLLHAAATWMMTGLIWFVQIVHYPLMARVGSDSWIEYERRHQQQTTWVVMPLMLTELTTGLILLPAITPFEDLALATPFTISVGLLGLIWLSTFLLQVPCHAVLSRNFSPRTHRHLVATNWIRTVLWSARSVIVLATVHAA